MEYRDLVLEKSDGIWQVTLNRPELLNAIGRRLVYELIDVLADAERDDECKVIVLTGAGRAFSSGADQSGAGGEELEQLRAQAGYRRMTLAPIGHWGVLFEKLGRFQKPTVAAVNGVAAGGGLSLALASDIRIASTNASFIAVFVRRALAPDTGTSYLLPQVAGLGRAMEMMLTGDRVTAADAERWGLVNRVVAPEALLAEARGLASRIAKGPSLAIETTKRLVIDATRGGYEAALQREAWALGITASSQDIQEGRASFLEKREPRWTGR